MGRFLFQNMCPSLFVFCLFVCLSIFIYFFIFMKRTNSYTEEERKNKKQKEVPMHCLTFKFVCMGQNSISSHVYMPADIDKRASRLFKQLPAKPKLTVLTWRLPQLRRQRHGRYPCIFRLVDGTAVISQHNATQTRDISVNANTEPPQEPNLRWNCVLVGDKSRQKPATWDPRQERRTGSNGVRISLVF